MRAKEYEILERAVEEGVTSGMHSAHKHDDSPRHDVIVTHVVREVMAAVIEVFTFEDDVTGEETWGLTSDQRRDR